MNKSSASELDIAFELQERAAAVGFDWPDAAGPRAKIAEELAELEEAAAPLLRDSREGKIPVEASASEEKVKEELGDLLFAVVNLARHLNVAPEAALAAANRKFQRRFRYIEKRLAAESLRPDGVDLARLDALWNEAKQRERISKNSPIPNPQDR
ncbi:MAG TPA: MazG nucleotide pyrophosphohydrolase domain-containing protein [Gammaproteobacteria bacterium]|nr:MazG nucleotide pyrophosphohydrolase domain-containing protein [Gammaproteobacteria bacterium]